jgi:type II secretory pathway pseudopilin PulG
MNMFATIMKTGSATTSDRYGAVVTPRRIASVTTRAFTLIEVSLATAVAAVAVLGLLVVLVAAFGISRKASDETLQGNIAQELFSEIRGCSFDAVVLNSLMAPGSLNSPKTTPLNLGTLTTNTLWGEMFFDPDGVRLPSGGPQYFKCAVKFGPMLDMTGQVAYAQLEFVEPAHTINPVVTNIFYTRISRYW